jgi:hypothetical protein
VEQVFDYRDEPAIAVDVSDTLGQVDPCVVEALQVRGQ